MANIIEVINAYKNLTTIKDRIVITISLALLLSIILVSCSKSSGSSTSNNNLPPIPNTVSIINMAFSPAIINVTVGTTVTWNNNDNMAHTVTGDDSSYDSGSIGSGSSFAKTYSTAGFYLYHCSIHPGMKATVIVK